MIASASRTRLKIARLDSARYNHIDMEPKAARQGAASTLDVLAELKPTIVQIAQRYGAGNIRVFGSAARGEDRAGSDIDLLVSIERGRTLLDLVGLEQELTTLLGTKVDVVVEGGLSPYLEPRILAEAVVL